MSRHNETRWPNYPNGRPTEKELDQWMRLTLTGSCECCDAPIPVVRRLALEVRELRERLEIRGIGIAEFDSP